MGNKQQAIGNKQQAIGNKQQAINPDSARPANAVRTGSKTLYAGVLE
jgi:hypothetical protein